VNRPFWGAILCVVALVLELALFVRHQFWGGPSPDIRLAVGILFALLVNLYLIRSKRKA
jgi:hypothetical protein